jgi:hypothetical protein
MSKPPFVYYPVFQRVLLLLLAFALVGKDIIVCLDSL